MNSSVDSFKQYIKHYNINLETLYKERPTGLLQLVSNKEKSSLTLPDWYVKSKSKSPNK